MHLDPVLVSASLTRVHFLKKDKPACAINASAVVKRKVNSVIAGTMYLGYSLLIVFECSCKRNYGIHVVYR